MKNFLMLNPNTRCGISQEAVVKLSKENFDADSWQFQLLERHESNNLNSYTVAELRQLLRFVLLLSYLDCLKC